LFLGHFLGEYEDVVAKSSTNAPMLKNLGANSVNGWLRQCGHLLGKDDDGTGADGAGTTMEAIRTQA
jgi:hypothetical protein